jgi:chitin disaccharide deacetylase
VKLIIHADDLGKSESVNEAIFALMAESKITSASILANGPAFEDAVRNSRRFPQCSFGVHLNLSQFRPLQPIPALTSLLVNGEFRPSPRLHLVSASLRHAIAAEWTAQVHRLRDAGVEITHIDSHHHAHTRFSLLPILEQLCREHRIRRVRIRHTFNRKPLGWRIDHRLYNAFLRSGFTCTDEFGPFSAFAGVSSRLPSSSTVELMVHPGHPRYEDETGMLSRLMDDNFRAKYQCITHRELN